MQHRVFPRLTLALAAATAMAACSEPTTTSPAPNSGLLAPSFSASAASDNGRYLVVFKGAGPGADFADRVASLGGKVALTIDAIGAAAVEGLTAEGAAQLAAGGDVSQIGPDPEVSLDVPEIQGLEAVSDAVVASPSNPAAATRFARQWHLRAIGADRAWAAGRLGSPSVSVYILDTGIGYTHPDLAGRVNLTLSRSFVPSDDAVVAALFPGAHPIADLHFHGTHVGATVSSNAVAAAGVTSGVTLVGVKVLSRTGSGPFSGILAGIAYAADNGADVINMSLGSVFAKAHNGAFMASLNRATNHATAKGTLIVVSAGNSAIDMDHDGNGYKVFCSSPNVVCVSATGPTAAVTVDGPWTNVDALAGYSNFGRSAISVAAPGGTGFGAVWAACSRFTLIASLSVCRTNPTGIFIVGSTGTSMASPHAAAVAALLVETIGHDRPSAVRAALAKTADDLGQPGTDPAYGKGRVNAFNAIQ